MAKHEHYAVQGKTLDNTAEIMKTVLGIDKDTPIRFDEITSNEKVEQVTESIDVQAEVIEQIKAALNGKSSVGVKEIMDIIDESGVLDSTDGTATEKVEQLIDKAEDDNLFRSLIENATASYAMSVFTGYQGEKIPSFGTITNTNTTNMFKNASNIARIDFYIDCPNSTNGSGMFYGTSSMKYLKGVNCINMTTISQMFASSGVEEIEEPLNVPKVTNFANAFNVSIKEIKFVAETIKASLVILSPVLSDESIESILKGLAPVETTQTLTAHISVYDKMLDDKFFDLVSEAIDKGWEITA